MPDHFWLTYRSVAIAFGAVVAVASVEVTTVAIDGDDRSAARYAQGNGIDEAITSEPSEEQDVTPRAIVPEGPSPVDPNGSGP